MMSIVQCCSSLQNCKKNEGVPSLSEQAKGSNFATIIRKIFAIMCLCVGVCVCVLKSVGQFTSYFEATFPFT